MSSRTRPLRRLRVVALPTILLLILIGITASLSAAPVAQSGAWEIGTLSDQNLHDLIAQMTVEEKDTFIHGDRNLPCNDVYVSEWVQGCQGEAGRIPGVATLGIPPLRLADGPAGVRLGHVETAMPAPVGLTASFDPDLAYLFGATVGRGQRATNQDVWLAPMMNIVNVPTAGRNFETLGEDPYLSGEMAVQLTLGSQSEGIIATLKHYVDNDFENGRNSTSVMINEQTQREMELAPFEKSIKEGGAGSVMCSYNRINDVYACGNDEVQNQILKGEWGWDGWIVSDWGATHRPQDLINGLDMEQSGSSNLGTPVINAISLNTTLDAGSTTLAVASTSLLGSTNVGDTVIPVESNSGFSVGQTIGIDSGANAESATIGSIATLGLPVPSYSATPVANWIWNTAGANSSAPSGTIYVRKTFDIPDASAVTVAALRINVDDEHDTYVNGTLVASSHVANGWRTSQLVNIEPLLVTGTNVIAVAATNGSGAGSMISAVQIDTSSDSTRIVSDETWKALSGTPATPPAGWNTAVFDDSAWPAAFISGSYPISPWNNLNDPPSTATYEFTLEAPLALAHDGGAIVGEVTPAGVTNLKVASVSSFAVGSEITIDSDANAEMAIISAVGTAGPSGTGITLAAPTTLSHTGAVAVNVLGIPAGTTNIKVASTSGFMVGHVIMIDIGAKQEIATVVAVGSSGPEGSGLDLAAPLAFAHAHGAPVTADGTPAVPATNDFPAQPAYSSAVWSARLDDAVLRILRQMNKAGLLEGTQYGTQSNGCDRAAGIDCVPFVPQRPDLQAIQPDEFEKAQLIAERSATLLKNETGLLPLSCEDLTSGSGVVLMGPTSISTYTGGGGSAHVRPYDPVESTYDALIEAATARCGDGVMVSYVPGYDLNGPVVPSSVLSAPDGQPGLLRQQITRDPVASGDEPMLAPDGAPDQVDPTVNYNWTNPLPANTAWRWTGYLTVPSDGSYALRVYAAYQDSAQLFVNGLSSSNRRINMGSYPTYFPDSMSNSYATNTVANKLQDPDFQNGQRGSSNLNFSAGEQVFVDLRVVTGETMDTAIQFRWVPTTNDADQIAIAEAAAEQANKVLYFAYNEGSEGSDRGGNAIANGLALAGNQDDVISAVAAASPNTVVVLNTGDPVFMPWESGINTILQMWYPGQMGGPATADVVLGNVNPSGKSPVTFPDALAPIGQRFPQDTQPAPCADDSGGNNYYGNYRSNIPGNCPLYPGIYTMGFLGEDLHSFRTINYTDELFGGVQGNGILQGYRWFDANDFEPLFPFGHGLSYTTFEYRNLVLKAEKGGTVRVSFIVQNKGDVAGAVVPQVYVGSAPGIPEYAQQAVRALRGFDRVELRPNEAKRVEITLDPRSFQYWDEEMHDWKFLGGKRTIWVGDSSRDLRLSGDVTPMHS